MWEHLGLDPWEFRPGGWTKRLNLGAGKRVFPAWTNHDKIKHSPFIDVACNLEQMPWCWPDNTFSRIDAWAILEHLPYNLMKSMDELWRILRPGGKVHIKVPDYRYRKAYLDPTHETRGWADGVFTFFDPNTSHGAACDYYSPYKWKLLGSGYTDKKKVAIWGQLRKVCSLEQWGDMVVNGIAVAPVQKPIIWINGRAGAGKSTMCRYLQGLYPNIIIVDDHTLWKDVFRYIYLKKSGETTATLGEDFFKDERPESMHRDFAIECALVAKSLAQQGHRVVVDMIASPQKRRDRIQAIANPFWIYLQRDQGEVRTPRFDKMEKCDLLIDNDTLGKHEAIAIVAKKLTEAGMLP